MSIDAAPLRQVRKRAWVDLGRFGRVATKMGNGGSGKPQSASVAEETPRSTPAEPAEPRLDEVAFSRSTPGEPRLDELASSRSTAGEPQLDEVAFSPHYGVAPVPLVLSPDPTMTDCTPKPENDFSAGVRFAASSESERFRRANKDIKGARDCTSGPTTPGVTLAARPKAEQLECISDTELDLLLADCENSG